MAILDSLSVRVTGNSDSLSRAINDAERSLDGLTPNVIRTAAALQTLQGRTDEAEDEMAGLNREALEAAASLSAAGGAASGASVGISGLFGSVALLTPALFTLASTLVPIIGALTGFVAVAGSALGVIGAIIGSGFIAWGEQLAAQNQETLRTVNDRIEALESQRETEQGLTEAQEDRLDQLEERRDSLEEEVSVMGALGAQMTTLRSELLPLITAFGEQFIPLVTDAVDAIPELVENMIAAAGGIGGLTDTVRQIGQAIFDVIPAFVSMAVTIAQEFLPPFAEWLEDILPRVPGMIMSLVDVFDRMLPKFQEAGRVLMDVLPPLLEFGFTALRVVGPALTGVANAMTDALNALDQLDSGVQNLVVVGTLIGSIGGALALLLGGPIAAAIIAIAALATAWGVGFDEIWDATKDALAGVQTELMNAATWLQNNYPGIVRDAFFAVGRGIRNAIIDIANLFRPGKESELGQIFDAIGAWIVSEGPGLIGSAFDFLIETIMAAFRGLYDGLIGNSLIPELFADIASFIVGGAADMVLDAIVFLTSAVQSVFEVAFNSIYNVVATALEGLLDLAANALGVLPDEVTSSLGVDAEGLRQFEVDRRATNFGQVRQQNAQEIRVVLDERTDVVESRIEEGANNVIETREQRSDRLQGRGTGI